MADGLTRLIICINHNDKIFFLILSSLFLLQHFLVDVVSSQESQMRDRNSSHQGRRRWNYDLKAVRYKAHLTLLRRNKVHKKTLKKKWTVERIKNNILSIWFIHMIIDHLNLLLFAYRPSAIAPSLTLVSV